MTSPTKLPFVVKLDDDTVLEEINFSENTSSNTVVTATEQTLLLGLLFVAPATYDVTHSHVAITCTGLTGFSIGKCAKDMETLFVRRFKPTST